MTTPKPYKLNNFTSRCTFQEGGGVCDGTTCIGIHYRVSKDGDTRYDEHTGGRFGTRVTVKDKNEETE